jgi:hypothetical protein
MHTKKILIKFIQQHCTMAGIGTRDLVFWRLTTIPRRQDYNIKYFNYFSSSFVDELSDVTGPRGPEEWWPLAPRMKVVVHFAESLNVEKIVKIFDI